MPRICLAAVVFEPFRAAAGIFEDQGADIVEGDLFGLPGGAYSFAKATAHKLLERVGLRLGWVPRLVEASEIRVVIGDPLLDRLPRWLDGLHCFDVEGRRWRAGEMDDAFHSSLKLRTARP